MCHVLVIEDEALLAMMICDVLEQAGASTCAVAASQNEAVELALAHKPDLITSDVKLAKGTGPLAVAAICEHLGPIPVVFITATPGDCNPLPVGATVISKPFSVVTISKAFQEILPV